MGSRADGAGEEQRGGEGGKTPSTPPLFVGSSWSRVEEKGAGNIRMSCGAGGVQKGSSSLKKGLGLMASNPFGGFLYRNGVIPRSHVLLSVP